MFEKKLQIFPWFLKILKKQEIFSQIQPMNAEILKVTTTNLYNTIQCRYEFCPLAAKNVNHH